MFWQLEDQCLVMIGMEEGKVDEMRGEEAVPKRFLLQVPLISRQAPGFFFFFFPIYLTVNIFTISLNSLSYTQVGEE